MKTVKRVLILLLTLLCVLGAARAESGASGAAPAAKAMLRVSLSSLGAPAALDLTLQGEYGVGEGSGFVFERGAQVTLWADEGRVFLRCGAVTACFGEELTLTRHASADPGGLSIAQGREGVVYPGSLTVRARGGWLQAVLTVDVETYLVGVVPYEMSDAFPLEALKAQAVAARTYALWRAAARAGAEYDLVDTAADQVYGGYDASHVNAIAAVEATKGVVGLWEGAPVPAYYSASNGGYTALPGAVLDAPRYDAFLDVRRDEADLENPLSRAASVTVAKDFEGAPEALTRALAEAASDRLSALGYSPDAADIAPAALLSAEAVTPLSDPADGRYESVRVSYTVSARPLQDVYAEPTARQLVRHAVTGEPLERTVAGRVPGAFEAVSEVFQCDLPVYDLFKRALGLGLNGSRDCETVTVETGEDGVTVTLRRFGHGVGLSQRGAQRRAGQMGQSCGEILAFYYPGLTFTALDLTDDMPAALADAPLTEVSMAAAASLQVGEGEYIATVSTSSRTGRLNVRAAPSLSGTIVAEVYNGAHVVVTAAEPTVNDDGAWLSVRTREGVEGWCAKDYLIRDDE